MSRAYRICVKESLSRHVAAEDGVSSSLELLPILSQERMVGLLSAELEQRGFRREGEVSVRQESNGVMIEVDLQRGQVSVIAQGHADLNLSTERVALTDSALVKERETSLRASAQASLGHEAAAEEAALQREVTAQLEATLRNLRDELDSVVNRVTGSALKQRASELGQVEEVHEEANGNLTIKVRI